MKRHQGNSLSSKDNNQNLHRVSWTSNKWGGKIGRQEKFDSGELLRLANIDEIVPGKEDYFMRPNAYGQEYYLIYNGFDKSTEYKDIKNFVKNKMIYVYKEFNKYGKH
mgnify:FL=1|tara:strand:+ start:42 stop:365 length:324 start_codon:yes stop_codon:yes gene_type:complete